MESWNDSWKAKEPIQIPAWTCIRHCRESRDQSSVLFSELFSSHLMVKHGLLSPNSTLLPHAKSMNSVDSLLISEDGVMMDPRASLVSVGQFANHDC
ncbi:hypothetical protein ARMGADRAFT_1004008 [Armillaria gallica]|uniref:Uncharacterized protein n=1 Tax=Armillaria gallica TaxID=47427 RepID=A0A2H3EKM1_ARMGA|nr:hypothetical protein ARMGADRAFT_1004008 [Armillaria gallica]